MTHGRTIAIASGKGGVGRSSLAVGLGVLMARSGRRVALVDLNLGLGGLDILLRLRPRFGLQHLLAGVCGLEQAITPGPHGLGVLCSGSGLEHLANLDEDGRLRVLGYLRQIRQTVDVVLLDTAPGISENVVRFVAEADTAAIVTTPEPAAVTSAYALAKVVYARSGSLDLGLLVNMARSTGEGRRATQKVCRVARQFLGAAIRPLGVLPCDEAVWHASADRRSFVIADTDSPVSLCLGRAAATMLAGDAGKRTPPAAGPAPAKAAG